MLAIASPDGADGWITIHQDARVYAGLLDVGASAEQGLNAGRRAWLHVARGAVQANGARLGAGDGAVIEDEMQIAIVATENSEVLLFDLP